VLKVIQTIKKVLLKGLQKVERNINVLIKLLPILSFIIPLFMLYALYPDSFEATWKGRTFYLFFLWLVSLELVLDWEKVQTKQLNKLGYLRTIAFIVVFLLPTVYVVAANYWGLNAIILDFAKKNNVPWANLTPLSTEYLVFTVLFASAVVFIYGIEGLTNYSISVIFLGTIGLIYTIDNLYPYGRFTPFQFLVPTTAALAANVLNLMGYRTSMSISTNPLYGSIPSLEVQGPMGNSVKFGVAWPCSGIESLLVYAVTIILFLKKAAVPWTQKLVYFIIGAIITYFINILRIVTIFVIAINSGGYSLQVQQFHDYYGPLCSIIWITSYPLIIIGSRVLWKRIKCWKISAKMP